MAAADDLRECSKCRKAKPLAEFHRRASSRDGCHRICKECLRAANRAYAAANSERIAERKRVQRAGRTGDERSRDVERNRLWRTANRDAARAGVRARRAELKAAALRHYGPGCLCCGELDARLLTIEHSRGDGAAHRRELFGGRNYSAAGFYRWLLDNGYPDDLGLAVMCGTCNHSSHHNGGVCPHSDASLDWFTSTDPTLVAERIRWLQQQVDRLGDQSRVSAVAVGANTAQS